MITINFANIESLNRTQDNKEELVLSKIIKQFCDANKMEEKLATIVSFLF